MSKANKYIKAKKYISNQGYGTGTNLTVSAVANLMIQFAEAYHKQELEGVKNPYDQKKQYTEWAAVENTLDILIRKLKQ